MRRSSVAFISVAILLTGCAEDVPTARWSKPGATFEQFVHDRGACVKEEREESQPFILGGAHYGGKRDALDAGLFVPCMAARGYRQDPNGFAAPPGDELPVAP